MRRDPLQVLGLLFTAALASGCDEPRRTLDARDAAEDSRVSLEPDVAALDAVDVAAPDAPDVAAPDAPDVAAPDVTADVVATDVVDAAAPDVTTDVVATDVVDAATTGGARGTPTIDGVLGGDWPAGSVVAVNAAPSPWGPTMNALRALRVAWDDANLYVGVDGVVEPSNAISVWIDRDYAPGAAATGVLAPSSLTDATGALDNAISCAIDALPLGFGAELVWATLGMQRKTPAELRPEVGLRNVSCPACAGDFSWVMGDAAVCATGATPACEVAIPWTAIYGGSGRPPLPRLGVFVRVTNGDGASVAPQVGLPLDPSSSTRAVTVAAAIEPRS
ncbi:MAG: hypothetical protein R3A48_18645 [Polyangiales bacterium]